jgi:hypothetical protein
MRRLSILPERNRIVSRVVIIVQVQGSLVPSLSMEFLGVPGRFLCAPIRPACRTLLPPACKYPRIRTAVFGFILTRTIAAAIFSAKDVLRGAGGRDRVKGKRCSSTRPRSACSTSRRPRCRPPSQASRFRSSKAC